MLTRRYLTGLCTQAAAAREMGLSLRQYQRLEEVALARWTLRQCERLRRMLDEQEGRIP